MTYEKPLTMTWNRDRRNNGGQVGRVIDQTKMQMELIRHNSFVQVWVGERQGERQGTAKLAQEKFLN